MRQIEKIIINEVNDQAQSKIYYNKSQLFHYKMYMISIILLELLLKNSLIIY